jgi:MYXO-CTERM domain-containing protein
MSDRKARRPLAPLAVERWCTLVVWGVVGLPVAFAVAEDEPGLEAIDGAFLAAVAVFLLWALRRQRRRSVATAPPVPPRLRIDSIRRTVALHVLAAPFVALVFAAASDGAGPAVPGFLAVVGAAFAWDAVQLQRWETRTGTRTYRQRIFFARGAPYFYRSRQLATPSPPSGG